MDGTDGTKKKKATLTERQVTHTHTAASGAVVVVTGVPAFVRETEDREDVAYRVDVAVALDDLIGRALSGLAPGEVKGVPFADAREDDDGKKEDMTTMEMQPKLVRLARCLDAFGLPRNVPTVNDQDVVQKAIYFLQRMEARQEYDYGWYRDAPASQNLTADYYAVVDETLMGAQLPEGDLSERIRTRIERTKPLLNPSNDICISQREWLRILAAADFLQNASGYSDDLVSGWFESRRLGLPHQLATARAALAEHGLRPETPGPSRPPAEEKPQGGSAAEPRSDDGGSVLEEKAAPSEAKGVEIKSPAKGRPSWDRYFGDVAKTVATRASCPRLSVGCVITRDKRILVTGYNGSPKDAPHCLEVGCHMVDGHCERTLHAEANAVSQAAKNGISIDGGTAYVTHFPCANCMKGLVGAGIKRVAYITPYDNELTKWWIENHGIAVSEIAV